MKKVIAVLAVMALLALPAAASADSFGYGPAQVEASIKKPNTPAAAKQEKGSLPFTGLQVGLVAFAGLALVGTGFGLRKLGGSRPIS